MRTSARREARAHEPRNARALAGNHRDMSEPAECDGRTARFERLFRAEYPAVAGCVRRRAEPGLVEDMVNEVFLVAWRPFDHVPQDPRPWLLGVARNVLGTHIRGARRVRALHERLASIDVHWSESDPQLAGSAVATSPSRQKQIEGVGATAGSQAAPNQRRVSHQVKVKCRRGGGRRLRPVRAVPCRSSGTWGCNGARSRVSRLDKVRARWGG
jgi:DNA-directed RNA polymerase specialized sigma24 family protein